MASSLLSSHMLFSQRNESAVYFLLSFTAAVLRQVVVFCFMTILTSLFVLYQVLHVLSSIVFLL